MVLDAGALEQTYAARQGPNKRRKLHFDPGIFPGAGGENPRFLNQLAYGRAILRILKPQLTIKLKNMPNKQSIFFLVIALIAGIIFSFRESGNGTQNQDRRWQLLSRTLNANPGNNTDTGGRAVNIDSAQHCIDQFASVMLQHGFSTVAGQKVYIQIKRTSMITTGEVFQGKGLLEWLTKTAAQYDANWNFYTTPAVKRIISR
jgi:hypothetical protein